MTITHYITHLPADGGKPRALVVLLHGLGSDGNDLIGLAPPLAPALPHAVFVAPDAPQPCDMAPYGHQWFSLQDRSPPLMARLSAQALPGLDAFLDAQLAAHGLAPDRLALVGFSQGCMMSLRAGLARKVAPAAIVGFSGALLAGPDFEAEVSARPPVLMVHGEADEVVPFGALQAAETRLRAAGVAVETVSRPGLGHSIDEVGLTRARAFLAKHLAD